MPTPESSAELLRAAIARDRERIGAGERPRYHATWTRSPTDGAADVRIVELPIIHLFVPDSADVIEGARVLIARTLDVSPDAFDVTPEEEGQTGRAASR